MIDSIRLSWFLTVVEPDHVQYLQKESMCYISLAVAVPATRFAYNGKQERD
jgi:hypothetical protein